MSCLKGWTALGEEELHCMCQRWQVQRNLRLRKPPAAVATKKWRSDSPGIEPPVGTHRPWKLQLLDAPKGCTFAEDERITIRTPAKNKFEDRLKTKSKHVKPPGPLSAVAAVAVRTPGLWFSADSGSHFYSFQSHFVWSEPNIEVTVCK